MLRKKLTLAVASLATAIAPTTVSLSSFVGARTATVAAGAAAAALLPMTASAQSGKRVCGDGWNFLDLSGTAGFAMEVYKWDVVTCAAVVVTITALLGPLSASSLAQNYFGQAVNVWRTKRPGPFVLQTCEAFTAGKLNNKYGGDACNSMQDYKIYVYMRHDNWVGLRKI